MSALVISTETSPLSPSTDRITSVVTLVVSHEGKFLGTMPEMPEQSMDNIQEIGKSGMGKVPKKGSNLVELTKSNDSDRVKVNPTTTSYALNLISSPCA
jgi:hypothetical protein